MQAPRTEAEHKLLRSHKPPCYSSAPASRTPTPSVSPAQNPYAELHAASKFYHKLALTHSNLSRISERLNPQASCSNSLSFNVCWQTCPKPGSPPLKCCRLRFQSTRTHRFTCSNSLSFVTFSSRKAIANDIL